MGKNIAVIGSGYVGLTTGTCLADLGNKVICVDNNEEKIAGLKNCKIPIFEPGLELLIKRNSLEKRLEFSTDIADATKKSDLVFLCVGTPPKENGETDLSAIENVTREIAKASNGYKIIVQKSTVPVNTAVGLKGIMKQYIKTEFDTAVNPEFLKEGSAVYDFMNPDRIVIGTESEKAYAELAEMYKPLNAPILHTDINSAELIKHLSNAMLAQKISTINLIAMLCEKTNADIETVAKGVGMDKRIGPDFLKAGIGYGGFCFPKDLDALIYILKKNGLDSGLFEKVRDINYDIRNHFARKISERFDKEGGLEGKIIGILGLAFKPNTDDIRLAPSTDIINKLKSKKAKIKAYDPKAMENSRKILEMEYCDNLYSAAENCDALLILTEWQEFKDMDLTRIRGSMKKPLIFDGRNIYNKERMKNLGFEYYCIGR
ncbi:UDP-glucose/GDP-mannose dehydrogenase family protein [Candidatus Pacearchaeota archaeon]|nr:UDP-glucose/GDP-mannose dehydrogenase family protein [Candidatus Pacearchaeota archaeon]